MAHCYVVDTNVVMQWYIPQKHSGKAKLLLDQFKKRNVGLLAPDLLIPEMGNVLWKYRETVSEGLALQILQNFFNLGIALYPSSYLIQKAYQMARTYQRSVYDSLFMALSLEQNSSFITSDERLYNAVSKKLGNILLLEQYTL